MLNAFRSEARSTATTAAAVKIAQAVIPRKYPLVFEHHTDHKDVQFVLRTWNDYFREHFDGVGYFAATPITEVMDGKVVDYYYLHSDLVFYNDFMGRNISIAPRIEAIVMRGGSELYDPEHRDIEVIVMEGGVEPTLLTA